MVELSKEESLQKISLRKDKVVSLQKSNPILDTKARVALVLDYSGSMNHYFEDGTVQSVIERLIPLALTFDDNGVLDFWIFQDKCYRLKGVTLNNFYGLSKRIMKQYPMGGTCYAPVMQDVDKFYMKKEPAPIVNYVIFITDGDNSDKSETTDILTKMAKHPIFFQFIGIGNEDFPYLKKLDDLSGRYVDNADFFKVEDINTMSDDDLYSKLFTEFPSWLKLNEVQEMLKNYNNLDALDSVKKKGFISKLFGK